MVKKSIEIAKRAKWLWIYGILLATGSGSFNLGQNLSSEDIQNLPNGLPDVFSNLERVFSNWVIQLTQAQVITFFSSVTIFIIFSMLISLIISNWANGSLLFGVDLELDGKNANLENTSPVGIKNFLKLLIFNSISFIIAIIVFPLLILLPGVIIYGSRAIVLKNYTPWNAWKIGIKMAWKYFFKTLKTGIISVVLSGLMGIAATLVILIVLGIPGLVLYLSGIYLPILLLLFVFVWSSAIITGFIAVFKTSLWNQVFRQTWKD